jgi:hypothetical protein
VSWHDDRINAGCIRRTQTRAQVVWILYSVEYQQKQRLAITVRQLFLNQRPERSLIQDLAAPDFHDYPLMPGLTTYLLQSRSICSLNFYAAGICLGND